ncbi:hypothetical protein [Streptomyces yangpuensis]|uniref:hypothetical protein n=1 Tax=Streptomyces yangpuensis TaxID=1648182 RepID=UPI00368C3F0E
MNAIASRSCVTAAASRGRARSVANGLWSCDKEIQEPGAIPTLLPHVLMVERGISLLEAVTVTGNLCDGLIKAFETKAAAIESTAPVQMGWLDVLRAWVRGNLEWPTRCRRYHMER